MSDVAIRVVGLSKQYHIGTVQQKKYSTLREVLMDSFLSPFRKAVKLIRGHATGAAGLDRSFWALEDVSFECKRGEVLGLVGGNGAGKSTLLKILSRITRPTEGYAEVHGRVASLLEVGTGFHPELTGQENIFLYGSILGMSKQEIESHYEEIVGFAEVEDFINTPIKHYSSGMRLRLAFAVAAHLEPEILLCDEVLAVGDAGFQKKCLRRMGEVAKGGRTVILVSHNMRSIAQMCDRVIWLASGRIQAMGQTHKVVHEYLSSCKASLSRNWRRTEQPTTAKKVILQSVRILSDGMNESPLLEFHDGIDFELVYDILVPCRAVNFCIRIYNEDGLIVMQSEEMDSTESASMVRKVGSYRSVCHLPGGWLCSSSYAVSVGAWQEGSEEILPFEELVSFEISIIDCPNLDGVIAPRLEWKVDCFQRNGQSAPESIEAIPSLHHEILNLPSRTLNP